MLVLRHIENPPPELFAHRCGLYSDQLINYQLLYTDIIVGCAYLASTGECGLGILPEYRRLGLGAQAVELLRTEGRTHGLCTIYSRPLSDTPAIVALMSLYAASATYAERKTLYSLATV